MSLSWRALGLALLLAACGSSGGGPCQRDGDCAGGLCLTEADGYPGGYCSQACESAPCAGDQVCRALGGRAVCLSRCTDGLCRAGYQCFQGLCQPPCRGEEDCGAGSSCQAGACVPLPGAPPGADCTDDSECAAGLCVAGRCARLCGRDADCPAEQTCALDRAASRPRALCVDRRGGEPPLHVCLNDQDCDRGSCLMGACLQLCQTPPDCEGEVASRSCTGLPAPLRALPMASWPEIKVCLPRNQVLRTVVRSPLLVPRTARSVLLFSAAPGFDENTIVGFSALFDPAGTQLYRLPLDQATYAQNAIRANPDVGCSSLLLSSSPQRAPLRYGAYAFQSLAQTQSGTLGRHEVHAFYQLHDAPLRGGRVPLRFHITDLSGLPATCPYRTLTAARAPTELATLVRRLREIFQQPTVALALDPITFVDSDAPSSVSVQDRASLRAVLRTASVRTSGGLDVVLVRSISPNQVLGIAGGIPASPGLPGTPQTGAVVSVYALCLPQLRRDQEAMAIVVAHELGHTLGLSHNREMDGGSDPLGDGMGASESYLQDQQNLMYWSAEAYGSLLTAEQGSVLRSMPQVGP